MRGSGPLLLLIPGGPADAGVFDGLSQQLAGRYTVVAYDPRGNSRSALDSPPEEQRVDLHADDAAQLLANNQQLYEIYRRQGPDSAMQRFMSMNGMAAPTKNAAAPQPTLTPAAVATFGRIGKNLDYFFLHGLGPLSLYRPDIQTLRASAPRIVVAVGSETAGDTAHRTGVALAAQLRTEPVVFPGDHGGYGPHATEFAEALSAALRGK